MLSSQQQYEQLCKHAYDVTPYLNGFVDENIERNAISYRRSESLQSLYLSIAQSHPEAGQAYWLTRTWELLCWQPVFLSFTAIYAQKSLPDITSMTQYQNEGFVSGFHLRSEQWNYACHHTLIQLAAKQLNELFDAYRDGINQWGRIRPGFTNNLLADQLLACLVRLQELCPNYSNSFIFQQAALWLDAFGFSKKHLHSLKVDTASHRLTLVRTTCCHAYKCEGRPVCASCPRLERISNNPTVTTQLVLS